MKRKAQQISIVVPVYNEQETLPFFYERIANLFKESVDVEFIFVDDGSSDASLSILRRLAADDARVRVLVLSRNFGQWAAITAGLHKARGDVAGWISCDLQDPPEVLLELLKRWEEGYDVVWGVRAQREDTWLRNLLSRLFYKVLRYVALPEYPPLGTDLCLMSRQVLTHFCALKERNRFTQGLIMSLGFRQTQVSYRREARTRGHSKWNQLSRLVDIAFDMLINFSARPLRWMLYLGLAAIGVSGLLLGYTLISRFVFHASVSGWASLMLVIAFFGGINAFMLGVLGEYVWRILVEVKGRPLYIIREEIPPAGDADVYVNANAEAKADAETDGKEVNAHGQGRN